MLAHCMPRLRAKEPCIAHLIILYYLIASRVPPGRPVLFGLPAHRWIDGADACACAGFGGSAVVLFCKVL